MKRNRTRSRVAYACALKVIEQLETRRLLSTTLQVTNTNGSGDGSFSAALAAAQAGDTIDLTGVSGTIETAGSFNIASDLTITGPGAGSLTFQGDGFSSVFRVTGGTVSLSGVTVTQQSPGDELGLSQGGGIYNSANLTLNDVAIKNCTVSDMDIAQGGGIYNSGTLVMSNCSVTGNSATNSPDGEDFFEMYGGGIYSSGSLTVSNCTIANNAVTCNVDSTMMMEGIIEAYGGGVYLTGNSPASFTNCTLANNSVSGSISGDAMDSIVESFGGAILDSLNTTLTLTNCTIAGNSAAAANSEGPAEADGGGIYQYTGKNGVFTNCIIAGNTAPAYPDLQNYNFTSGGHNLIGIFSQSGFVNGTSGDQVGSSGSPIDPKLNALGNYGGPTQTMSLQPGSPAIDAGDNAAAPALDQRGYSRSGTSDIGAFEFDGAAPVTNHPPAFADGPLTRRFVTNNAMSWTISATDSDHDELTFSATTTLPAWLILTDNRDGTATLSGTPANADAGPLGVTLSVSDGKTSVNEDLTLDVVLPRWQLDSNGLLTIGGENTADDIHVWMRHGQVRVIRDGAVKNFPAGAVSHIEVYGGDGDDMILLNTRHIAVYASGGAGNDTLIGSDENDILTGGGGNDDLYAGGGSNRLNGSEGDDRLFAGNGDNRLFGDEGADTLIGGSGHSRTDHDVHDHLMDLM